MKKTLILGTLLAVSLSAQDSLGQYANFVMQSPAQNVHTLESSNKKIKIGVDYFYDNADAGDTHFVNIPVQALVTKNIYLEATLPFKYIDTDAGSESGFDNMMVGAAYAMGELFGDKSHNVFGLRYNIDTGDETVSYGDSMDMYWDSRNDVNNFTVRSGILFNFDFGDEIVKEDMSSLLSLNVGHKCLLTNALQTNAIVSWYTAYGDTDATDYNIVDLTIKWDTLKLKDTPISFGAKIPLYATDIDGRDLKTFTFFVSAAGLF